MSFLVEKLTAAVVTIDDLGLTITGVAGTQFDLTDVPPQDVARSADLISNLATELRVVDPRDTADTILLDATESQVAIENHNNTQYGVSGGRFGSLDDPNVTLTDGAFTRFNASSGEYEEILAGEIGTAIGRKEKARLASTQDFTAGPFSGTYNASGGTGGTGAIETVDLTNPVDGVVPGLGDRIVLKDQAAGVQNGIFSVATAGAVGELERAVDHDSDAEVNANDFLFVSEGTTLADTSWAISTDDPITLNTTAIVWAQVSGPGAVTAGDGIDVTGAVITLDVDNLTTAVVALGDEVASSDITDANLTRKSTWQSVLNTLDIPYSITANGIIVRTADDTYASRSVTVDGAGALDGLAVANGNGVAGDPVVGLDINGLPAIATVASVDRIPTYDIDGAVNGHITVSQLISSSVSTINGQPVVTFTDTTRASKVLSVSDAPYAFGNNRLAHLDWMKPAGTAADADSGYIMPLDGTVVFFTTHTEDAASNTKDIHLFIDGVDQGSLGQLTGAGAQEVVDATINLDFTQNQKLRLQAVGSGSGRIEDTTALLHVRWRA